MRVSELCHLKLDNVWLEEGMLKVLGKGNKERLIPIGKQVQRCLWRYISRFRSEPASANSGFLFLTRDGRPMTKDRVEKIMTYYGKKTELKGVRCSPHTLRHSAAVRFLRNGGDVGEIDATVEGDDAKIAFNGKYLTDVLSVLKEAQVALETTSPSSPGLIRPVGTDNYTHVVMPMFVQW